MFGYLSVGAEHLRKGLVRREVRRCKQPMALTFTTHCTGAKHTGRVIVGDALMDPKVAVLKTLISRCLVNQIKGPRRGKQNTDAGEVSPVAETQTGFDVH